MFLCAYVITRGLLKARYDDDDDDIAMYTSISKVTECKQFAPSTRHVFHFCHLFVFDLPKASTVCFYFLNTLPLIIVELFNF